MDKALAKAVLRAAGLPVLDDVTLTAAQYDADPDAALDALEREIGCPMVVKPVNLGSSVGISKASGRDELRLGLETAFRYAERVLCERAVSPLREINCAVLGDALAEVRPSVCEEPAGQDEILSFADKYSSGGKKSGMASLKRRIPADIPAELTERIQAAAVRAFQALGCSGVARVDFLLEGGDFYVNEVNTIPGSLAFYLWEAGGVPFPKLCEELLALAFARKRRRDALTSSFDSNILAAQKFMGKK
jgi:D-alanine-D-alanine ligase